MKRQKPKQPKVRRTWGDLNPVTKVIPNKKKYKRNRDNTLYGIDSHEG